jgi:hypothetical protein
MYNISKKGSEMNNVRRNRRIALGLLLLGAVWWVYSEVIVAGRQRAENASMISTAHAATAVIQGTSRANLDAWATEHEPTAWAESTQAANRFIERAGIPILGDSRFSIDHRDNILTYSSPDGDIVDQFYQQALPDRGWQISGSFGFQTHNPDTGGMTASHTTCWMKDEIHIAVITSRNFINGQPQMSSFTIKLIGANPLDECEI